ncbi:MAG: PfkB family carbohydrate kinase, partial [Patescibacteria group bacterium]
AGAYAYDGNEFFFTPMYPDPAPPIDRTGAGDSFASAIVSALVLGLPLSIALLWGPINSMSVVQYIGAREGLLTQEKIEKYLKERPEHYKVSKI